MRSALAWLGVKRRKKDEETSFGPEEMAFGTNFNLSFKLKLSYSRIRSNFQFWLLNGWLHAYFQFQAHGTLVVRVMDSPLKY
jgi:hypothetical protein